MPEKKSCGKCGWEWVSYHICIERTPEELAAMKKERRIATYTPDHDQYERARENSKKISAARKAKTREENAARDENIIALYVTEQMSRRAISEDTGVNLHTVGQVLREANKRGVVSDEDLRRKVNKEKVNG